MDDALIDHHVESISAIYERFLDRLEAQVLQSIKDREIELRFGSLTAGSVMILPVADFNFRSELDAEARELVRAGAGSVNAPLSEADVEVIAEQILDASEKSNHTTYLLMVGAFREAYSPDVIQNTARLAILLLLVKSLFSRRRKEVPKTAEYLAVSAANYGSYAAALLDGRITKTWVSQRDVNVRDAHRTLDGDTVSIDQPFFVLGVPIRFPGDPVAPPGLVINCRCFLRYGARAI